MSEYFCIIVCPLTFHLEHGFKKNVRYLEVAVTTNFTVLVIKVDTYLIFTEWRMYQRDLESGTEGHKKQKRTNQ